MIVSIDGRSLIGVRHYEVARLLKELPRYYSFDMTLVEPRKAFAVAPRGLGQSNLKPVSKLLDDPSSSVSDTASLSSSNTERPPTLRLKSDGQALIEEAMTSWTKQTVERVDDLLESFMGIRDNQLAHVIVDLARDKSSVDEFIETVASSSSLGHFQFPPDFITELWSVIR
ncbi:PREDICTED: PDZ domain-containing protein GIPC1-like [Amphimedon queenslandica]|uniref:GIPC GH2 domain-containing protein n=1 Tax=Amphimedon queenslandica TaxID=400682 RepID=A0A1X7SXB2_AMPQE|nr:PREDICTED: PDZ domain-containing protein GIPC1-like [Amphimedon queenslandica]|eukprot:XP_019862442.1 PREDICTED: PDZ domain-containing protein GIPC1-like [Amphimedon queenslandica]